MSIKDPNPLNRPDVYSLSTGSSTVAATEQWVDPDRFPALPNGWQPIVNTAGDRIEGLKKRQVEISMSIKANRSDPPFSLAKGFVNKTNSTSWQGGAPETWLCTGISAQQQSEMVGEDVIDYWSITFNFSYREDGWYVRAPNVGLYAYYFVPQSGIGSVSFPPTFPLQGGLEKRRITVTDENGVKRPSAQPLPLADDGKLETQLLSNNQIKTRILVFTVYRAVDFKTYFDNTSPIYFPTDY